MLKRFVSAAVVMVCASFASATQFFAFSDPGLPGLRAEAEFTLLDATTLQIRLRNTSTGVPAGFDSSDQLLTGLSWDFGGPGLRGTDVMITGGSVLIGPFSMSLNFSTGSYGPGSDVSGEYGYGNMDGTGALANFISANTAQATPFGGPNLDGPDSIDGPQAGLVANPAPMDLGGLGAIQDEIIATLSLNQPITEGQLAQDLERNLVRVEYGSDAAFITVPEPATVVLLLLACGGAFARGGRRSR